MSAKFVLKIKGVEAIPLDSLIEASVRYQQERDRQHREGWIAFGADMPEGRVYLNGEQVARVSYNGRVWPPGRWKEGARPLYEAQ